MTLDQIADILSKQPNVFIVTHKNPDGDAMGSSLGLASFLRAMGASVSVVAPTEYPDFLNWIEGNDDVLVWGDHDDQIRKASEEADLLFCLDFNALHRIDEVGGLVAEAQGVKVMIDHHQQPDDFADFMISDTSACSTAELVYKFVKDLNGLDKIGKGAAEALYCGIMTDTGSFRFPSTTAETHEIVADLMNRGAEHSMVHRHVYDSNSYDRLRLLGHCMLNMEMLKECNTAFIKITKKDHARFNIQKGDTEGLVNYALSMPHIQCSAFFREDKGIIKISFRSKDDFDVNQFARKYFNGGGHVNAAGGMSKLSLDETVEKFKQSIKEYYDAHQ